MQTPLVAVRGEEPAHVKVLVMVKPSLMQRIGLSVILGTCLLVSIGMALAVNAELGVRVVGVTGSVVSGFLWGPNLAARTDLH